MDFTRMLRAAWEKNNSLLCVGLDPDPLRFPAAMRQHAGDAIFTFCKAIIDATADQVCAFKPQIAYFAAHRAEEQLEALISHIHQHYPGIPVILDAKRGDIGSTAEQYAREAFERYQADAVTVNPYMGWDSIAPYCAYPKKGVIVLCRTSNSGGSDLQMQTLISGECVYEMIAHKVSQKWNISGNLSLVVGATFPQQLKRVREIVGEMPLLVPGIGAQGGSIPETIRYGCDHQGTGLMINASRAILYASPGDDFASAARRSAIEMNKEINSFRYR